MGNSGKYAKVTWCRFTKLGQGDLIDDFQQTKRVMVLLESGLDPIPSILDDDPIDRPFASCPLHPSPPSLFLLQPLPFLPFTFGFLRFHLQIQIRPPTFSWPF